MDNPGAVSLTTWLYLGTALAIAFLAALWLSLVIWTIRDMRLRSQDRLARVLAVVVVALLGLPGLVIYLLLRPSQTVEEAYQATLEEEALLEGIANRVKCPGCSRQVEADWQVCPSCTTRLRKPCPSCGRLLELSWKICPFCTASQTGV